MDITEKHCGNCKEVLPITSFYKDKRTTTGLQSACKTCHNARTIRWQSENRESCNERSRQWKEANPDKTRESALGTHQRHWYTTLIPTCRRNTKARNGKGRGHDLTITAEWVRTQAEIQGNQCYWSGMPLELTTRTKSPYQVSIDRIDSTRGYTPDNCVLVCQCINYLKHSYDLETFEGILRNLYAARPTR